MQCDMLVVCKMKVLESLRFVGCATISVAVLSLVQCGLSYQTTPSPSPPVGESLQGDFVQFDPAPIIVRGSSSVRVTYQCSRPCKIGVELVLSTPEKTGLLVFRRRWTNLRQLRKPRTRKVLLTIPPSIAYKRDFFVRRTVDARDVMVRAWLSHLDRVDHSHAASEYHGSLVRTFKLLQMVPPSQRPPQPRTRSLSWGAELMWQLTKDRVRQCPFESDTIDLLKFPFVSTGERFGVVRKFHSFINRELESERVNMEKQPRVTLSVWIYLLDWCSSKLCGIVKHVNEHNKYGTPLIMLTNTGDVVVQARLASGQELAFTAHTALPVQTWIRLDCFILGSQASLKVHHATPYVETVQATHTYDFQNNIQYNDTTGYFVIGGGTFMPGILGYIGPIRYYRLGSEKVINPLTPAKTLEDLDKTIWECEEIKQAIVGFLEEVRDSRDTAKDVCHSYYGSLRRRFGQMMCRQSWTWEMQREHSVLFKRLHSHQEDLNSGWNRVTALRFSGRLFEDAVGRMARRGPDPTSSLTALLRVSSCLGHHQASLLLATVHLAGLGVPADQEQAHVYSLIGAMGDDRLALLHLGYKHAQGLDGFPKDYDVAYGYYANVGRQTSADGDRPQDSGQYMPEHIHLSSEAELETQTSETGDLIQFVKLQAERGDIESQKIMAKVLFWGHNGVAKDIRGAVRWYARSAMQMTDATAMYDYSILLFKGTGVKKNTTLGLKLMEKAAAMGSGDALNGLGWYYSTIMKDQQKAIKYFELAAQNGSCDAIFNLGVYHLNGTLPDKSGRNETAAFHYFLKASQCGHVDGAVEAASYLSTGNLRGVSRDPRKAVILLKRICEKNGYLGYVIREALQAYLQGSWDEALVKYAMLAETGLGVAQSNAAHLCEELKHSYDCHWRYYNYSTYNHAPHASGLLKMGDYYSHSKGAKSGTVAMATAIAMYSRAALAGSPQGIFNLAVLTEEGHEVPESILEQMQVSAQDKMDQSVVVEKLLLRCIEFEEDDEEGEDLTPCSLALLRVRMGKAWKNFTQDRVQLSLACGAIGAIIIVVVTVLVQSVLGRNPLGTHSSPDNRALDGLRDPPLVNQAEMEGNGLEDDAHRRGPQIPTIFPTDRNVRLGVSQNRRTLQQAADLVVTVTGVCLCALCTMFLSHLL